MSKYVDKGIELENECNFEGALNRYEMALDDPSCPFDIRSHMGRVQNKLRNYKESLSCFDTVLNMDDNHIESLFGKGISCLGLNKWDEALGLFLKAKEIDDANANFYYYISIILQSNNDDNAVEFYSKFIELDNEEFEQIRKHYKFGLKFDDAELRLAKNQKINIKDFERALKSFEIKDDEIDNYLKTLPYEDLISKINELNDLHHEENEKRIIRSKYLELGFTDKDVDDYFILDGVDVLKEDIISRTNDNPFPDKTEIDIPLICEDIGKYIFEELIIEENSTQPVKNERKIKDTTKAVEKIFRHHYKVMMKAVSKRDFECANWYSDFVDESKILNEYFKVNFIYMRGLILSSLNLDLNNVLDDFNKLEKEYPEITKDNNYLYNKNNIEKDLEKSNQEMIK